MFMNEIERIVIKYGGYREATILNNPHTIEKGETWNKDHKVLNILEIEPDQGGYRKGFAVDLVTMSICG